MTYLGFWDWLLKPFGRYAIRNRNYMLGVQVMRPPFVTHEMRMRGTTWARTVDGGWREVCDFCGGNCGQCGMTERLGNPGFNFDRLIDKSGMKNPPAGLPRP